MDFIFENYNIQSAEARNTINLELPLPPLQRAPALGPQLGGGVAAPD